MKIRYRILVLGIILTVTAGVMCMRFLFGVVTVNGRSMEPLLHHGDNLVYQKGWLKPKRGDVIVFEREGEYYIKRVYGVPGDKVEITEGGMVLVNQIPLENKNLLIKGKTEPCDMTGEVTLGQDEYFVLGDHRTISRDSRCREAGNVRKKEVVGIFCFKK